MPIDLTMPLESDALLVIDPYPLADSVNFQLRKGESPLRSAETWLSREINAEVKLQHAHGDRFTAWVNGSPQRDTVQIKVHMKRKRTPVTEYRGVVPVLSEYRPRRVYESDRGGHGDGLWAHLTKSQQEYVRRGFEESQGDEAIALRDVPIDAFAYSIRSLTRAQADVSRGKASKTSGPISVRYDPDKDVFFLVDGHHRLAEALSRKKRTINVKLVGSGYSDYWTTPV